MASEWPSVELAREFWNSDEYEAVKKLREGAGGVNVVLAEQLAWLMLAAAHPAGLVCRFRLSGRVPAAFSEMPFLTAVIVTVIITSAPFSGR
jgi:hypothetical protein